MRRVHIVSLDGTTDTTQVFDADTGAEIKGVTSFVIRGDAAGGMVLAELTLVAQASLDIVSGKAPGQD